MIHKLYNVMVLIRILADYEAEQNTGYFRRLYFREI